MAVRFKYKKSLYTKQGIKDSGVWRQEDLKEEYTRLARLKNSRITRIRERFPRAKMNRGTDTNPFGVDYAPKWKDMLDKNGNPNMTKVSYELNDAYRFLKRNDTTITGMSKRVRKSIKSFNKILDGNPINEENIWDLFDFLDDYRTKYNTQIIPNSDQVIDIFAESERLNIDTQSLLKDIDFWREHYNDMKDFEPIENGNPVSSDEYREKLR